MECSVDLKFIELSHTGSSVSGAILRIETTYVWMCAYTGWPNKK